MLLFATLKNMIIRKKRKESLDDITFIFSTTIRILQQYEYKV